MSRNPQQNRQPIDIDDGFEHYNVEDFQDQKPPQKNHEKEIQKLAELQFDVHDQILMIYETLCAKDCRPEAIKEFVSFYISQFSESNAKLQQMEYELSDNLSQQQIEQINILCNFIKFYNLKYDHFQRNLTQKGFLEFQHSILTEASKIVDRKYTPSQEYHQSQIASPKREDSEPKLKSVDVSNLSNTDFQQQDQYYDQGVSQTKKQQDNSQKQQNDQKKYQQQQIQQETQSQINYKQQQLYEEQQKKKQQEEEEKKQQQLYEEQFYQQQLQYEQQQQKLLYEQKQQEQKQKLLYEQQQQEQQKLQQQQQQQQQNARNNSKIQSSSQQPEFQTEQSYFEQSLKQTDQEDNQYEKARQQGMTFGNAMTRQDHQSHIQLQDLRQEQPQLPSYVQQIYQKFYKAGYQDQMINIWKQTCISGKGNLFENDMIQVYCVFGLTFQVLNNRSYLNISLYVLNKLDQSLAIEMTYQGDKKTKIWIKSPNIKILDKELRSNIVIGDTNDLINCKIQVENYCFNVFLPTFKYNFIDFFDIRPEIFYVKMNNSNQEQIGNNLEKCISLNQKMDLVQVMDKTNLQKQRWIKIYGLYVVPSLISFHKLFFQSLELCVDFIINFMELQLIKKEMFFLLLYGVIFLALSLLMTGLFATNDQYLYVFEWVWLCFLGKCLSIIFVITEDNNTEEEREQLLMAEISEHKQTYIPFKIYLRDAIMQAINICLICFEIFYMNFGLFIICQSIVLIFYLIYTNKTDKAKYLYVGCLILSGIFSIAYDSKGNEKCYIGLIATLLQIGSNIYSISLKQQFTSQYVFQHSRYILYTGLIQFIIWTIPIIIVNFIPCPTDKGSNQVPKCLDTSSINNFKTFFTTTNSVYPIIVFVILILIGTPLSYLENKIRMENLSDKMQIIEQLVLFPVQIWIFSIVKEYDNKNNLQDNESETDAALYILCILCFIIQWIIGLFIIFKEKQDEKQYQIIEEDEDSELS